MKRLLIGLLILCLPLAAMGEGLNGLWSASPLVQAGGGQPVNAVWQGEALTLQATAVTGDSNAVAIAWQVTSQTQEPAYLCLERVYVNGVEVPLSRSLDATYGWLENHAGAALWDMSALPEQSSYDVTMSFLTMKPAGPVTWLEEPGDLTDYLAYQQSVVDFNNAGYVVSNPDGYILLSAGTYDAASAYPYQLLEAGKMIAWENPTVSFTFVPEIQNRKTFGQDAFAEGETVATVEWSPLSLCVTMEQTLSSTLTQAEAEAAVRNYAILDGRGGKDWYQGDRIETEPMTRQADGSWRVVTRWSTQSLQNLPREIQLTPYTYDVTMSRVYDQDASLVIALEKK